MYVLVGDEQSTHTQARASIVLSGHSVPRIAQMTTASPALRPFTATHPVPLERPSTGFNLELRLRTDEA